MQRFQAIIALVGAALLAGCQGAHVPGLARAGAPGLSSDPALRNAANPNAPYASAAAKPALRERPAVLDADAVPPCNPAHLSLFESGAQSSGARHTIRLTFANRGEACRLRGFPSLTLLRANGSVLGSVRLEKISDAAMAAALAPPVAEAADERADSAASPNVLLAAGGGASFKIGWTAGENCEGVARVAVGAPGAVRPMLLNRSFTLCEDRVLITALASAE